MTPPDETTPDEKVHGEKARGDGSAVTRTAVISATQVEALAGLLGVETPTEFLPELWHWTHLLDLRPHSELGPDGHPTSGIPAPPGADRRRMFAGGRVTAPGRLRIGEPATRRSEVVKSVTKQGRSGPLEFVTVRHLITQAGEVVIEEENDIVYLPERPPQKHDDGAQPAEAAAAADRQAGDDAAPHGADLSLEVDEALLFRFSALTYNAHRIHYDHRWAAHEGYDDLVVHGPLQALMMGEALRRTTPLEPGPGFGGRTFAFRLERPMVGPQRLDVVLGSGGVGAQVRDTRGVVTASSHLVD